MFSCFSLHVSHTPLPHTVLICPKYHGPSSVHSADWHFPRCWGKHLTNEYLSPAFPVLTKLLQKYMWSRWLSQQLALWFNHLLALFILLSLLIIYCLSDWSCWRLLKCKPSLRFCIWSSSYHIICFTIILSALLASTVTFLQWPHFDISNLASLLNHTVWIFICSQVQVNWIQTYPYASIVKPVTKFWALESF
jgi:hypothetical protein